MLFLGHWISKGVIQMDQEKIRSVVDWEVPKKERAGSSWWSQMLEAIIDTARQLKKSRTTHYYNQKEKALNLSQEFVCLVLYNTMWVFAYHPLL